MADVIGTQEQISKRDGSVILVVWEALTSANSDGSLVEIVEWADRTVQVIGTFDSATLVWQGSNNGLIWATLSDAGGAPLTFTSAGLSEVLEVPRYVRPSTSGGGGSQDIDVLLVARRSNNMRT